MGIVLLIGVWSFLEATLFFIVADLPLSFLALRKGLVYSLRLCLLASLLGTLGGALVYLIALNDSANLSKLYTYLPGISPHLINSAAQEVKLYGLFALFKGAFTGTPYKLYALEASQLKISFLPFILASLVARFVRFAVVCILTWTIASFLNIPALRKQRLLALFWLIFYSYYFWVMGV